MPPSEPHSPPVRGHFIDGQWVPGEGPTFRSVDPSRPSVSLGTWRAGTAGEVDAAVRCAAEAARDWALKPLSHRIAVLDAFARALEAREDVLARTISREMGKPLREARGEARALGRKWVLTRACARAELAPVHPEGVPGFWDWRPLGVMAVLGPFNFPVHLSNGHILPALVAGNAVVLKPSESAPRCAEIYVEAWAEAAADTGTAPALLSLVQGDGETGARLVAHERVDIVAFTGSLAVGRRILAVLADRPWVLPALEMGGKNAAIVLADADPALAAQRVASGAWGTTGQRCTATSRVIVHRDIATAFLDELLSATRDWTPGAPLDEDTLLGPLATEAAWSRFRAAQAESVSGLDTILSGGGAAGPTADGWWVRPAVHRVVGSARPGRWRDELFGPELLVLEVDDEAAAVEAANDADYGLAISVFSRSRERFDALRPALRAGLVHWNRATAGASSAMPFGGVRGSGNHRPAGILSLRYCVHPVATLLDPGDGDDDDR
ncbi:MAG: aldehyde dehydrogenase family protein [Deltaproteobacteria bacterium]|nr:MAG: aldehyde dehydrogenase family protein [Deltaproteobacteria bacterium]